MAGKGAGKGGFMCDGSCCAHGGCIRWTALVMCFIWMVLASVSVGLPLWYKVEVDLSSLKDVKIKFDSKTTVTSLHDMAIGYGVGYYCQNYAKKNEATGKCMAAPLSLIGTAANDKALTLSDGSLATYDSACCDQYVDGGNVVNNFLHGNTTGFKKSWDSLVHNSILDVKKNVPATTMGLSITALMFQFFAFTTLIFTVCCCHGKCAHCVPMMLTSLASFFYMVTAIYWAVQLGNDDNAYTGHCAAERKLFTPLFNAQKNGADMPSSLNAFVDCRSFVSYYGMWINFAFMCCASCMQSMAMHRAVDASEAEQEQLTAMQGQHEKTSYGNH